MSQEHHPSYSIKGFESIINGFIKFVFYYRMVLVFGTLTGLAFISSHVWNVSAAGEQWKNVSIVFGLSSISLGIFYSILNYENNHIKYKIDAKKNSCALSFVCVNEWHKPTMVENLKVTKKLFDAHRNLIQEGKKPEFFAILESDEEGRSALVSILNYFECMAIGIKQNLLDEEFMRITFKGVAEGYSNNYGFYIEYRRAKENNMSTWINFTEMAKRWSI